jgi:hypothetical protein
MKRPKRWTGPKILIVIGVVGFFLAAFLVAGLWLITQLVAKPSVTILFPSGVQIVDAGEGFSIVAQAQSDSSVQRIEFLVDGQIIDQQSPDTEDAQEFLAVFPWFGDTLGSHQLQVIAYGSRGQASEPAFLDVGVQARSFEVPRPDFVWIPPTESDSSDADGDPGQIIPADEASEVQSGSAQDGGAPAADAGNGTQTDEGGEQNGQEGDVVPAQEDGMNQDIAIGDEDEIEELLAVPDDDPPRVLLFDATPIRQGERVIARISAEVEDDLGVERLMIFAYPQGGFPNLTTSLDCAGEQHCQAHHDMEVGPGTWWFVLNAFDSSGHGIEAQYTSLDVIAGEDGPPAVAALDFDTLRPEADIPTDEIADLNLDLGLVDPSIFNEAQLDQVFDLNLGELFSGEERQVFVESSRCARIVIVPQLDGNQITAHFLCDEASEHNEFLSWKIQRQLSHGRAPMGGFRNIHEEDFPGRTRVSNGETLTFNDQDILCGADYYYRLMFYWKSSPEDTRPRYLTGVDLRAVQSQNCPPGAFNNLGLKAEAGLDGVQLNWQFLANESWPGDVDYKLWRHRPDDFSLDAISQGQVDRDTLHQQSPEYSYYDPIAECGYNQHYYSLTVNYYNQLVASDSVSVPRIPCPEGSLGNIEIGMIPGYALDPYAPIVPSPRHYEALFPHFDLPPDFPWPAGDDLVVRVVAQGEERTQPDEHLNQIRISPGVRANGYDYDSVFMVQCSDEYLFHLELWDGGQLIEAGPSFDFKAPPCLPDYPMVPKITTVIGTDNGDICGDSRYCVVIEWGGTPDYPFNMSRDVLLPVSWVALKRDLAVTNLQAPDQLWHFQEGQTRFVDTDIPCGSYPGESLLRYNLIGMAAPGIYSAWSDSTGFVDTPACGQAYFETGRIH